jgi:hypothetical protein
VPIKVTESVTKVMYLLQHFCFINIYSYTDSACGISITFSVILCPAIGQTSPEFQRYCNFYQI